MSTHTERMEKFFDGVVVEGIKDAVKTEGEEVETGGPFILVCEGHNPPSDTCKRKQI